MTSSPEVDRELLSQLSPDAASPDAASPDAVSPAAVPEAAGADLPGDLDLADRNALRRVAGLSTELTDVTEVEYRALRLERVVLVGVWTEGTLASAENSLRELSRLAGTAAAGIPARPAARQARPGDLHRRGQGARAGGPGAGVRGRHGHLRRRADPRPAPQPGGRRQGQGHRPHRAHPRHLRPARTQQGRQGAGGTGAAA